METLAQFAASEIRPRARACEESGSIPAELLQQAHELGLTSHCAQIPRLMKEHRLNGLAGINLYGGGEEG